MSSLTLIETVRRSLLRGDDALMEMLASGKIDPRKLMHVRAILDSGSDILLKVKHDLSKSNDGSRTK